MTSKPAPGERYQTFDAFYPYYIHEHSNRTCRRIHVVGTFLGDGLRAALWLPGAPPVDSDSLLSQEVQVHWVLNLGHDINDRPTRIHPAETS